MKKTSVIYLIVTFTLLVSCNQSNQGIPKGQSIPRPNYDQFFDDFFNLYESEGVKSSLNYAYSTNQWIFNSPTKESEEVQRKLEEFTNNLGRYCGRKLLKEKVVNSNFVIRSYMLLYERQPLRFTFTLYKPESKWQLQSFQYDVGMNDEAVNSINLSW